MSRCLKNTVYFSGLRAGDTVSVYADLDGKCLKGWAAHYDGRKLLVGNGISQVSRNNLFNSDSNLW